MTAPSLLVLAAGMGSRYGGLKQMDPMGPSGEWMLEYSVHDAWRAGFRDIVFVIRRDFSEAFCEALRQRLPREISWRVVHQETGLVPDGTSAPVGREKPLGTGHAIWCAAGAIDRPFAVINADDFYGAQAYQLLGDWLQAEAQPDHHAMVAYALRNTLSPHGHVSRGVCEVDNGLLRRVTEVTRIERDGDDGVVPGEGGDVARLKGDTPVSMNLWGFHPAIFQALDEQLRRFLGELGDPMKDEFYIPSAVDELIAGGRARVSVLRTEAQWLGVTYPGDRERVRAGIELLCGKGAYPGELWNGK
jgi:UTP-glucose-1-phosphate uridylyltransferase